MGTRAVPSGLIHFFPLAPAPSVPGFNISPLSGLRPTLCPSGGRVDAEHFYEVGDFAQMAQGILRGLVVAAQDVDVGHVFPWGSAHGAGLDLAQAYVAQREDAELFEERAGDVLHLEGN